MAVPPDDRRLTQKSEPIFNVPTVVVAILAALIFVHVVRVMALTPTQDIEFLLRFAFIPARYEATLLPASAFPGGTGAKLWTFVTYAFIHADLTHIAINGIWLLAFGSAVARRFGTARFVGYFAITAAAGALAHLALHAGELHPMVGASAAISGMMAGAVRFMFQAGGPLSLWRRDERRTYGVRALPLLVALRDFRVVAFLVVWFALNLLFGIGSMAFPGVERSIAWEAHIGGFLAGLVLFALFDPAGARREENAA